MDATLIRKNLILPSLVTALLVHLLIFVLVGSYVIFEGVDAINFFESDVNVSSETTMEPIEPVLIDEPEPLPDVPTTSEYSEQPAGGTNENAPPVSVASDLIVASTSSSLFNITSAQSSAPNVTSLFGGGGRGGGPGGSGSGPGRGSKGNFFGNPVSGKLGVVFDVSQSTHDTILEVIEELENNFAEAPTVCVSAASFFETQYEAYRYKKAARNHNVFRGQWKKSRNPELTDQIKEALENRADVYAAVGKKFGNEGDDDSNLTAGVRFLADETDCQEIYIFSDFADGANESVMEGLAQMLAERSIKLNALVLGKGDKVPVFLKKMCQMTGGSVHDFKE